MQTPSLDLALGAWQKTNTCILHCCEIEKFGDCTLYMYITVLCTLIVPEICPINVKKTKVVLRSKKSVIIADYNQTRPDKFGIHEDITKKNEACNRRNICLDLWRKEGGLRNLKEKPWIQWPTPFTSIEGRWRRLSMSKSVKCTLTWGTFSSAVFPIGPMATKKKPYRRPFTNKI